MKRGMTAERLTPDAGLLPRDGMRPSRVRTLSLEKRREQGKPGARSTRSPCALDGFEVGISPIRIFVLAAKAGGRAARSTFRVAPADVVKALLDCGEARFDHRLKFEVGEDIWPVLFDAFADEFTGLDGIYALRDAFPDHIDVLGSWARSRQGTDRPLKALGEIAS